MYCPNCGKQTNGGKYCGHCGYNLTAPQSGIGTARVNKHPWRGTKKWRIMKVYYWLGMPLLGTILWIVGNAACGSYCYDSWGPVAFTLVLFFMGPLFFLFRWIVGYVIGHDPE